MRKKALTMILAVIFSFALILSIPLVRSQVVMSLVSWFESFNVLGRSQGLTIDFTLPGSSKDDGLDWFSRMLLFNTDNIQFSRLGLEGEGTIDLSIYYTFGNFDRCRSTIFYIDSPYNSAFYGAYIIKLKPQVGSALKTDLNKLVESVTRYDYTNLILSQLGMDINKAYFEPMSVQKKENVVGFGSDGWTQKNTQIKTLSVIHKPRDFKQHYIQFGKPSVLDGSKDFPEITIYGRTYFKYFSEQDLYVVFYIQAMDQDLINQTDKLLLSKSKVVILGEARKKQIKFLTSKLRGQEPKRRKVEIRFCDALK